MKPVNATINRLLLLTLLFAASACAGNFTVTHEDQYAGPIQVHVDGALEGTLEFGEELALDVKPGFHRVVVTHTDQSEETYNVFVDTEASLRCVRPERTSTDAVHRNAGDGDTQPERKEGAHGSTPL